MYSLVESYKFDLFFKGKEVIVKDNDDLFNQRNSAYSKFAKHSIKINDVKNRITVRSNTHSKASLTYNNQLNKNLLLEKQDSILTDNSILLQTNEELIPKNYRMNNIGNVNIENDSFFKNNSINNIKKIILDDSNDYEKDKCDYILSLLVLNQNYIVAGTFKGSINLFNLDTNMLEFRYNQSSLILDNNISDYNSISALENLSSDYFVVGTKVGYMLIFKNETMEIVKRYKDHASKIKSIKANSKYLASASNDNNINVYAWTNSNEKLSLIYFKKLSSHTNSVNGIEFNESALNYPNMLISCSSDSSIKIWNYILSKVDHSIDKAHRDKIWNIVNLVGESIIISSGDDCMIKLWDLETYKNIATFTGHTSPVLNLKIIDNYLVSSDLSNYLRIWLLIPNDSKDETKLKKIDILNKDNSVYLLKLEKKITSNIVSVYSNKLAFGSNDFIDIWE